MKFFTFGKRIGMLFIFTTLFTLVLSAQTQWRAVSPAEMKMKTSQVEPDADAEAIFWEIQLDDKKRNKLYYQHYVRVKIFTEKGRERFSKLDIPFVKGKKVEDVAARVIKADGTIIELDPNNVYERDILTIRKNKLKAKSFALPGIETGAIVEYQYKETFKDDTLNGEKLYFQRDIPMQKVTYSLRPYKTDYLPRIDFKNMEAVKFVKQQDGFFSASLTNVPAFKEEPQMPPEDEAKMWAVINSQFSNFSWFFYGNNLGNNFYAAIKANRTIKDKALQLTANLNTQDDKVKAIYEFCRSQIRNASFDTSITYDQRLSIKNKKASDVLDNGVGNAFDIDLLFASLVSALDIEANLALSGDRSENFFNPDKNVSISYIHPAGIAVKIDNEYKYCSPGIPYKPYGMLDWFEENVYVMITSSGGFIWKKTPLSKPEYSLAKRSGEFSLSKEGTLEGTVKIEYIGHQALSRRRQDYKESPSKREEDFTKEIKNRISTAEISAFSIENFNYPEKPLIYQYKIRVPNYAQKTGKRLFFQPGFFEYGESPVFSSAERKYGIYFSYGVTFQDSIEYKIPIEYGFDNLENPGDISDPDNISKQHIEVSVNRQKGELLYTREFYFGNNGNLLFPATVYKPLKTLFDLFHEANAKSFSLKQK